MNIARGNIRIGACDIGLFVGDSNAVVMRNNNMELILTAFCGIIVLNNFVVSYRDNTSPDMDGPIWGPGSGCRRHLTFLEGGTGTEIMMPPELQGDWVSTSCEIRPGPEFVTRKYRFNSDLSFVLHQFYYSDNLCQTPSYSLRIRGQLHLGAASLAVVGAIIADYEIDRISLVSFNSESADHLRSLLNSTCLHQIGASNDFQPNERIHLLNTGRSGHSVDCTSDIGLSVHELQLIRQQSRFEPRPEEGSKVEWDELRVGDIHSDWASRQTYRPTTFQVPLRKYIEGDQECEICRIVHGGSETEPPVLPQRVEYVPAPLIGEWASLSCEAKQMYFLTRHLLFLGNTSWEAHYHFYKDPLCRTAVYTLSMKGSHSLPVASETVEGGTNVNLKTLMMTVMPQHKDMIRTLNTISRGACNKAIWKIGQTHDITAPGNCASIGPTMPLVEYDLFTIEDNPLYGMLMYTGQSPSDGGSKDSENRRPTAYQEPMVHCEGEFPVHQTSGATNSWRYSFLRSNLWMLYSVLTYTIAKLL